MALEQVVRNKLSAFEHEQYESHYQSESDRLAAAMQAEVNILNNPASSAEAKAAAASYIDTLNIQRQTIENLHNGFRGTESPPDPDLDAALHAHLEPALSEMTFTEVAVDDSSRGALFALAADADGADDAEAPGGAFASVDADVSALAAEHVHALSDVFDDVATAEAAPSAVAAPTVSDESQMTGGGPPLPPGIRTMAVDPSALPVDPLEDDALGVAVEAAAVPIADLAASPVVAASTFAPVGPDLGDPDDVLQPVLSGASADLSDDLPDPISGPMADGSEDLPEDDSPNPLDDLDDPLDPSLP
jgi:hypothetical protein